MIVIAGAGISGLTAAKFLDKEFLLLEKENYLGGLSTQYQVDGHWFDFSGHYFHFMAKEDIRELVEAVCRFQKFNRTSKTFAAGRYIPFPLQFHLAYLPAPLRRRILWEVLNNQPSAETNLHDYLESHFGKTLFALFFKPFLSRYYDSDLHHLVADMDKGSIPPPDKERIAAGAAGKKFFHAGYNAVFYYPRTSLRDFIAHYAASIDPARIHMKERITAVDIERKQVETTAGSYHYDRLITSLPLNELLKILRPAGCFPAPEELHHISTLLVNVVLKRQRKRFHWVYVAEEALPFYRVGFYPLRQPPVCYLERTVPMDFVICRETLHAEVAATLTALKLIESPDEIQYVDARVIPVSYILFTKNWHQVVPPVLARLQEYGIYSIGRYGTWNYSSMSDDIKTARLCALECNRLAEIS